MTVTFSEAIDPTTVNPGTFELRDGGNNLVPATVSYDGPSQSATLVPTSPLTESNTYTARLMGGTSGVKDLTGNALAGDQTWSFATASPERTIWPATATPTVVAQNDPRAVELGVKFQTDIDGFVTGIRFYKGTNNTGTHVGNLWTSSGQLLATATFNNETPSGWQQVDFAAPVAVTANTTYLASYHTPTGFYSIDTNYFATNGVNNPPLRALANGVAGSNGVYQYGPGGFPTSSFNSSNYWVDVVFKANLAPDVTPPTVTISDPTNGAVISGTVNVSAGATDDVGVAGVQFRLDGVDLEAEGTVAPYSIAWNTVLASNGVHTLTAVARDTSGNLTTSAGVSVTVDNPLDTTPPTHHGCQSERCRDQR